MHFNLKRAVGVMAIPLLGSALAVGATALPAHAATWQDTGLSASAVTLIPFGGGVLGAANGTSTDIVLSATGTATWSLHGPVPAGVILTGTTLTYLGAPAASTVVFVDATDTNGNVEVLQIPVTRTSGAIQLGSPPPSTANLTTLADTTTDRTVTFSTASVDGISFVESSLPAGLVGGPTLTYVGGTAAAGTHVVDVTATDPINGAVQKGTFSLSVFASDVYTIGSGGDEVNILSGTYYTGAVKFEYAPDGAGTGLCVTDPGGSWKSDPLPDGLILTKCDTGPWQQFVPEPNGTLRDVATGLVVKPSTTAGAQLRGATGPVSWGGSVYGWTNFANLPA